MVQTFLSGFHSLPLDIQQKVYDLVCHQTPTLSLIQACDRPRTSEWRSRALLVHNVVTRTLYNTHVHHLYQDVVLDRKNVAKFFYPIQATSEDDDIMPVDWDDPPERWPRMERQQVFQLDRSDPPPVCMASFRPTARKLLLFNDISSITFMDEEAVYQTERAALLYYKMSGNVSLNAIASSGGYVQEVLFLRADRIVFGADVAKYMVYRPSNWEEKVRNLSYAFRGPTRVRLEIPEDIMEHVEEAEMSMNKTLIYLGCVELERRARSTVGESGHKQG
ncbi:Hypothetical protein CGB_G3210C [Cryptococcus gattii WM276]|uniref:Uncharacterized protein n=2 Tax=Cryptococcus gattii TaxID=37769 RepID=E6R9E7_CRYGW|nr:Hypothetical protein CGB_G3210C [Cryptococcus gattii WM276]ADV23484.1 Hypothetical protein CGB_G3210C [Cryptococcus gattii WM276]KIR77532.1 hypothetical protein I306_05266 [Cryptococcus gattii EJB2]KJE01511.1 hypothetical protein I311_04927 [Cryptococcus gattii NT-10]